MRGPLTEAPKIPYDQIPIGSCAAPRSNPELPRGPAMAATRAARLANERPTSVHLIRSVLIV